MTSISDLFKNITASFAPRHKGVILGIDIGSSSIKVVTIEKVEEKVILRNYGEIALGPRGNFSVGQSTSLPPEKIAVALKDLLKEAGIVAHHTLIAIPFSASLLTVAEFPDVEEKELESMIPLEARRYIPVPISEVSLDWWVLPKRNQVTKEANSNDSASDTNAQKQKVEVIVAAIQNEVIKKYESIKQDAQIPGEASHFEIEVFSTLRAVVGRDLSPLLVIDIGAGSTKLALVDGGVVRGSHVISVGGQDITHALARSKDISFEQAEEIKCRVGMIGDSEGRDILTVSELLLANVMNEAARFSDNYERKYNTKIQKIILVGGGARLKGIEKIVKQNFQNTTIVIGDPFSRVDTPAFLAKTLKELSPEFAVSLGIALKGLEE